MKEYQKYLYRRYCLIPSPLPPFWIYKILLIDLSLIIERILTGQAEFKIDALNTFTKIAYILVSPSLLLNPSLNVVQLFPLCALCALFPHFHENGKEVST